MEEKKEKKGNKVQIVVGIVVVVLVAIIFYALGANSNKDDSDSSNAQGNQVAQQEELEEGFEIETSYCTLKYPTKWEGQVRVEKVEGDDSYSVEFYGTVEGREEQHLFDIVFDGDEGYTIGYLTKEDDKEVAVNIISHDLMFGDDWTEEEKNTYCAMQEDVNYIISVLRENEQFEEAM